MRSRASVGFAATRALRRARRPCRAARRAADRARCRSSAARRWPRERAHHGARVAGVGEQPQPGQQVADLGTLEERRRAGGGRHRPAPRARRRPGPASCASSTRTETSSGATPRATDALDAPRRTTACACARSLRSASNGPRRVGGDVAARSSSEPVRALGDHGVGGVQDRLPQRKLRSNTTTVARGRSGSRGGSSSRRREPVDRLKVVADRRHVAVIGDDQSQQQALREFVSCNSSTSTCRKRVRRARTCGFSRAPGTPAGRGRRSPACPPRPASGRAPRRSRRTRAHAPRASGSRRCRRERRRPRRVVAGRDQLVLEAIDAGDDRAEQRARVAAQVVVDERQLVHALEQHREPVRRGRRRGPRIDPRLERLIASSPAQKAWNVVTVKPPVGALERELDALAQLVAAALENISARISSASRSARPARGLPPPGARHDGAADGPDNRPLSAAHR